MKCKCKFVSRQFTCRQCLAEFSEREVQQQYVSMNGIFVKRSYLLF